MIGAGIGVTPFVSILKDIKYKWARKAFAFDVKRAYFFWMVNDQESFSWFSDLLKGTIPSLLHHSLIVSSRPE